MNIKIAHKHINVEIGTEATHFLFREYINGILVALLISPLHKVLPSTAIHGRIVIEFSSPKNHFSLFVAGSALPMLADEWDNLSKGDINMWLLF